MVTVDCHLHLTEVPEQVPHWWMQELYRPYGVEYGNTDGAWMVDLLDRSGIDIGMVQGSDIRRTTYHPDHPDEYEVYVPNDYTADQVAMYPDRLKGVACIDPMRGIPWAVEELERCVKELDFRALKLVPSYQLYSPNDRSLDPLYEKAIELDIPVHFFTGWTPIINASLELGDPFLLDGVGTTLPRHEGHRRHQLALGDQRDTDGGEASQFPCRPLPLRRRRARASS